ncbi:MAG: hypothetical protein Ct9H300mP25_14960 [Acidobacteriota bacterium]|nr:MAG: hypothetical protein Ct9H300mP25_14960 [Acidobacteriota bacterium]
MTIDRDPVEAWRKVKSRHPPADELIPRGRRTGAEVANVFAANPLVTLPENAGLRIAPTPEFYRWTFASLWTPGPFERGKGSGALLHYECGS